MRVAQLENGSPGRTVKKARCLLPRLVLGYVRQKRKSANASLPQRKRPLRVHLRPWTSPTRLNTRILRQSSPRAPRRHPRLASTCFSFGLARPADA